MTDSTQKQKAPLGRFTAAAIMIAAIWVVSFAGFAGMLETMPKLLPRTVNGLWGILTMPLLHAGMGHLLSNTLPIVVFSVLISLRGNAYYICVTLTIMVAGGLLLWVFGRPYYHIGASGLAFGYFGFLLLRFYYSPSLSAFVIAAAVIFIYGGLIWGVLPQRGPISWDGHLAGLAGGMMTARLFSSSKKKKNSR